MDVDTISVTCNSARGSGCKNKSVSTVPIPETTVDRPLKRNVDGFGTPSHVLFSMLVEETSPAASSVSTSGTFLENIHENPQRCLRIDSRVERDYICRRKRAYERADWSSASSQTPFVSNGSLDGVSKIERALVNCCESLEDDFYIRDNKQETGEDDDIADTDGLVSGLSLSSSSLLSFSSSTNPISGVLDVQKETRFAAILSKFCRTMSSRSLALAILERTLKLHRLEEETSIHLRQEKRKSKDDENSRCESSTEVGNHRNIESNSNNIDGIATRLSQHSLRCQNRIKRLRLSGDENGPNVSHHATIMTNGSNLNSLSSLSASVTNNGKLTKLRKRRFELFFAAGGLRILNQWLTDASSYDTKTKTSSLTKAVSAMATSTPSVSESSNPKNYTSVTTCMIRKAHTTRPIALSILLFLEHIPFEKKTVTNSKINRQIQKLGKKVSSIKEAHQMGKSPKEDLDNWATAKPLEDDEALTQILAAVESVKKSWREKAKRKGKKKELNALDALQLKIKKRSEILTKFESGALLNRPDWYRSATTSAAVAVTKKHPPLRRKPLDKADIEKSKLKKKIKQVQSRSQKNLRQLREKLRQRKPEHNHLHLAGPRNLVESFPRYKKVAWKDGLKCHASRNRQTLEEVIIFGKHLPSSSVGRECNLRSTSQSDPSVIREGGTAR